MLCCFGFLMIAVLGGMFALLSYVLCAPLHAAGLGWMYFAMMGLLCSVNAALAAVPYLWLCKKGTALFAAL